MGQKVTDPALLAALNAPSPAAPATKAPIDPAILAQLNGTVDADPDHKPVEDRTLWDAAKYAGRQFRDSGKSVAKLVTGGVGSFAGDIAGLTALAANLTNPLPNNGSPALDPMAVKDKVAEALTYKGAPDTFQDKVVSFPGKFLNDAGDEAVTATGTESTPLAQHVIHAVPQMLATMIGASAGGKAPLKGPAAVATVAKEMTPAELHQTAVKTLLDNGVQLTNEQRGIGTMNKVAGIAGRAADVGLWKSGIGRRQLQAFTKAVFDKVGIKAENATPDAMAELKQSTTNKYNAAHNGLDVGVDATLAQDLADIHTRAQRNAVVEGRFDKMLNHIKASSEATPNGPRISAKNAEEIRHELGLVEGSSDANIRGVAGEVKDALDAAVARSATPAQAAVLKEARGQYHFMRQIEDAVDSKGGFISPKKLLNVIERKRNKNEAVYGKGDQRLVELARAGAKVLPDSIGDSGTATRVADLSKIAALVKAPLIAGKVGAGLYGARLLNEARSARGTPADLAAQNAKRAAGSDPIVQATRMVASKETQEEKKRRLRAEALKGSN